MVCCGKTIKERTGFVLGALPTNIKYEHTDDRVRVCQKCNWNFWIKRNLFCQIFLRRFGTTLWPDPTAFVPTRARAEKEICPLHKW